ncbi:MAG: flagellar basal body rod protein FlgC [Phycisphaerae bacterium]|nr:flagellar basal body rod protein FlgC [Phycisphaerae bacterium]
MSDMNVSPVDIAISGLRAQSKSMNVIANNIANAQTTNVGNGQPFRRQMVRFSAAIGDEALSGVDVGEVVPDMAGEMKRMLMAGHPDADADGYVTMPNVSVPTEMMHMVTATRAYQASAAVLKRYQDITDTTLELLR